MLQLQLPGPWFVFFSNQCRKTTGHLLFPGARDNRDTCSSAAQVVAASSSARRRLQPPDSTEGWAPRFAWIATSGYPPLTLPKKQRQLQRPSLSWSGTSSNKKLERLPSISLPLLGALSSELFFLTVCNGAKEAPRHGRCENDNSWVTYFLLYLGWKICCFPDSHPRISTASVNLIDKTGIFTIALTIKCILEKNGKFACTLKIKHSK